MYQFHVLAVCIALLMDCLHHQVCVMLVTFVKLLKFKVPLLITSVSTICKLDV